MRQLPPQRLPPQNPPPLSLLVRVVHRQVCFKAEIPENLRVEVFGLSGKIIQVARRLVACLETRFKRELASHGITDVLAGGFSFLIQISKKEIS